MRFFVKYNAAGDILSVAAVEVMPPYIQQPFSNLTKGEKVLEAPTMPELESGNLVQVQTNYRIDVNKKQLIKKS